MTYIDTTNDVYDLEIFQDTIKALIQTEETTIFGCSLHGNVFKISVDKGVYNYIFPKHYEPMLICIYVKSAMDIIEWNLPPKKVIRDKSIIAISILK